MSSAASTAACTGSPSLNLVIDPHIGYQWPNNSQVSGYVCTTAPFGEYSAQRFAACCQGTVHTVSQPTAPGDISYPASCVSWCFVNATSDITGNTTPANPYGFSDYFLCLYPGTYAQDQGAGQGGVTCGWVNDPNGPASTATQSPSPTWNLQSSYSTVSIQTSAHTADPPLDSSTTSLSETTSQTTSSTTTAPMPTQHTTVTSSQQPSASATATTSANAGTSLRTPSTGTTALSLWILVALLGTCLVIT
ncbi:hypothetical protein K461DRAFT_264192 [Myriangium duriaei CBS 260.36]|uniref:Uncharacterized protein n=1 Tax=Myriangium duriaei CBS 260.36 TaxID=1168546 RepID=A0A9P4J8F6_9PEZI|nr:hypothetical protein K461DRAFT_264192 [Myriangium duriaei CBS 260.36]